MGFDNVTFRVAPGFGLARFLLIFCPGWPKLFTSMKILGNRVLLEPLPKPTVSEGGIHFVMRYQDDKMQWRVAAVGTGTKIPAEIQVGCSVLSPLYFDHFTLEDGTGRKIVGIDQLIAVWGQQSGVDAAG